MGPKCLTCLSNIVPSSLVSLDLQPDLYIILYRYIYIIYYIYTYTRPLKSFKKRPVLEKNIGTIYHMASTSDKVFDHTKFTINVHRWFLTFLALEHSYDRIILGLWIRTQFLFFLFLNFLVLYLLLSSCFSSLLFLYFLRYLHCLMLQPSRCRLWLLLLYLLPFIFVIVASVTIVHPSNYWTPGSSQRGPIKLSFSVLPSFRPSFCPSVSPTVVSSFRVFCKNCIISCF